MLSGVLGSDGIHWSDGRCTICRYFKPENVLTAVDLERIGRLEVEQSHRAKQAAARKAAKAAEDSAQRPTLQPAGPVSAILQQGVYFAAT